MSSSLLASPSLDSTLHKSPSSLWSKKQRRSFHRVLSGLKRAHYLGVPIRFMTLTSADRSRYAVINDDFEVLRKRIVRHFGRFEYCKIRTSEGNGVIHVLYRGSFVPQSWLSDAWGDIHGSPIVDIRLLKGRTKPIARYLAVQYMSLQIGFTHLSWSWRWICRGFVRIWHDMVSRFGYEVALRKWDIFLSSDMRTSYGVQLPLLAWC